MVVAFLVRSPSIGREGDGTGVPGTRSIPRNLVEKVKGGAMMVDV